MENNRKILPNLAELELVRKQIKTFPNQRKESLRGVHWGCFYPLK